MPSRRCPPLPRQFPHPLQDPRGPVLDRPHGAHTASGVARARERAVAPPAPSCAGEGPYPLHPRPSRRRSARYGGLQAAQHTCAVDTSRTPSGQHGGRYGGRPRSQRFPAPARDGNGAGGGRGGCGPGSEERAKTARGEAPRSSLGPFQGRRSRAPNRGAKMPRADGSVNSRGRRIRAFPVAYWRIV